MAGGGNALPLKLSQALKQIESSDINLKLSQPPVIRLKQPTENYKNNRIILFFVKIYIVFLKVL
jgi:hypothetical protein